MPESVRERWQKYGWRGLAGDASGGAIAALIALPYGLAMAKWMGLPPELGLWTSIVTAPVTAILGRNPVLIGGTSSVTVPFILAAVRSQGIGGAAKVGLVAAVFLMVFCVLRLGRYVAKVPHAVVSGFSCGVGAMMVLSQLRSLLGLQASYGDSAASALSQLAQTILHLREVRHQPLLIGTIVILGAAAVARRWPRSPAPLVGIGLAIFVATMLGWHEQAVGAISLQIPAFVGFKWEPTDVFDVLPNALGLAFVTSVNVLITSRVLEHFRGRHRPLKAADADAELGAYGIANLCTGVFGAPMSVGIAARSLANVRCGGRTRLSNFLHAAFLLAMVWYGSSVISRVPLAALAGVTAFVGLGLLEWSTWRRLPRMRKVDASAFLATAFAVVASNAIAAVAIGCSLYFARHVWIHHWPLLFGLRAVKPREIDT